MMSSINTNYSVQNTKPSFKAQLQISKLAESCIVTKSESIMGMKIDSPSSFIHNLKEFFKQLTSNTEGVVHINKLRNIDGIDFSYQPAGKIKEELNILFSDIINKPNYKKSPEYKWTLEDITKQLFPSFKDALAETMALFKHRPWDKVALDTTFDPILSLIAKGNRLIVDSKATKNIDTPKITNLQRAMYKTYHLKMQYPADREKMSAIMSHNLQNTFAQLDEILKTREDFAPTVNKIKEQLADAFSLQVDTTGKIIPPSSYEAQILLKELIAKQSKM